MSLADKVNQFDGWLLDRIFQPAVDRLPEKPSGFDIGMSMQLGAVVLDAASLVAMVATGRMGFGNATWNVLTWLFAAFFYVSISRMRPLVKPGHANPLRFMLQGLRPLSIPFAIYSLWIMMRAPPMLEMALRFNALANFVYVVGLYFISCQPKPPAFRRTVVDWTPREARSKA
ncbi:hypothetical protein HN018_04895 [Lichenicola cladoniae]|uniref:Uncharacterized protein n=1 Tax=Lichenicola cladoniae TaxID=1484109 RepID=A0A6M8HM73_9PROT|nr:hypothetical protein [Lichenicola cladoniae]NPD66908.1 hypothetical protein [Acetobacteraceae bacterium]QKE89464.1 hypothetical protein HN018_04895 [Lichenicola cladoniae]